MRIGDWESAPGLSRVYGTIRELDLETNIAELETFGFTVVPPEKVHAPGLVDRLQRRLLAIAAERNGGTAPDLETGGTHADMLSPAGQHLFFLLNAGPEFEEALTNPTVLALVTYLMGDDVVLSSCTSILKGPGTRPLPLHSDTPVRAPFPAQSLVCNATYLLTDYTREDGALCFVPGSHRLTRQPTMGENFASIREANGNFAGPWGTAPGVTDTAPGAVPVEAPKGSLVVWHGNTWHGAFNRVTPGIRMNLILYFCSPWIRPQEAYRELLPAAILDRNDEHFARLVGRNVHHGWAEEGPENAPGAAFERHRRRANALVEVAPAATVGAAR